MTLRACHFGFLMRIVAVTILTAATASFALARPLELDQGARQIACLRESERVAVFEQKRRAARLELELGEALAKELGVALESAGSSFRSMWRGSIATSCSTRSSIARPPRMRICGFPDLTPTSGVAIALRPGIEGIKGFGDLRGSGSPPSSVRSPA